MLGNRTGSGEELQNRCGQFHDALLADEGYADGTTLITQTLFSYVGALALPYNGYKWG